MEFEEAQNDALTSDNSASTSSLCLQGDASTSRKTLLKLALYSTGHRNFEIILLCKITPRCTVQRN